MHDFSYKILLDQIRYLITITHLDFTIGSHISSRVLQCPCKVHSIVAKRVLSSLKHTHGYALACYYQESPLAFIRFTEVDWFGLDPHMMSKSSFVFSLARSVITWST